MSLVDPALDLYLDLMMRSLTEWLYDEFDEPVRKIAEFFTGPALVITRTIRVRGKIPSGAVGPHKIAKTSKTGVS